MEHLMNERLRDGYLFKDPQLSFFKTMAAHEPFRSAVRRGAIDFEKQVHVHLPRQCDWNLCFKCGKDNTSHCSECEHFCDCYTIKLPPIKTKEYSCFTFSAKDSEQKCMDA